MKSFTVTIYLCLITVAFGTSFLAAPFNLNIAHGQSYTDCEGYRAYLE